MGQGGDFQAAFEEKGILAQRLNRDAERDGERLMKKVVF